MTLNRLSAAIAVSMLLALGTSAAASAAAPAPAASPALLAPGDVVQPFEAARLDGSMQRIEYPKGKNTVILFFLSSCSVCHRMIPLWNEFYGRKAKDLQVVGVMLDREPPGFFTAMPVAFPIVRSPGPALHQMFKLRHVPLMVRVGAGGRVDAVSEGITDQIKLGEIFRP
jgi:thiol-disulfide isomerase/thioredoxin